MAPSTPSSRSSASRRETAPRSLMRRVPQILKHVVAAAFLVYGAAAFATGFSSAPVDTGNLCLDLVGRVMAGLLVMIL